MDTRREKVRFDLISRFAIQRFLVKNSSSNSKVLVLFGRAKKLSRSNERKNWTKLGWRGRETRYVDSCDNRYSSLATYVALFSLFESARALLLRSYYYNLFSLIFYRDRIVDLSTLDAKVLEGLKKQYRIDPTFFARYEVTVNYRNSRVSRNAERTSLLSYGSLLRCTVIRRTAGPRIFATTFARKSTERKFCRRWRCLCKFCRRNFSIHRPMSLPAVNSTVVTVTIRPRKPGPINFSKYRCNTRKRNQFTSREYAKRSISSSSVLP